MMRLEDLDPSVPNEPRELTPWAAWTVAIIVVVAMFVLYVFSDVLRRHETSRLDPLDACYFANGTIVCAVTFR